MAAANAGPRSRGTRYDDGEHARRVPRSDLLTRSWLIYFNAHCGSMYVVGCSPTSGLVLCTVPEYKWFFF